MLYDDLRSITRQQPFRPFRIHLTDGTSFEVYRQDGHILTLGYIVVAMPKVGGGVDYDRTTMVDLAHVIRVETIQLPVPPGGNGQVG